MMKVKRSYKTVLLGDASVGKSSFAVRLTRGEFSDNTNSTIGAAFFTHTVMYSGGDSAATNTSQKERDWTPNDGNKSPDTASGGHMAIKFDIWDTAGQERFKSIAPIYYRGAACALVILDVSAPSTLQHATSWVNQLRTANSNDTIIVLVANKIDLLASDSGAVETLTNAKAYAKDQSLHFVETSAKTGQNIALVFEILSREIAKNPLKWDKQKTTQRPLRVESEGSYSLNFTKCCSNFL
ncbi:bifunctional Small GTPase/Small GTP-binding protein domain/P-loop containing nucleoside triphosphate hydrolase [Babesia duncani]|uniref:Bifunctional Small GTPase/Small GTP-binding protein domain/P-loop containing nucleoside triphosphate hydrolase n=1 Tax=Babesia duncani TaxID=323732 RepID=A0AAD9UP40_9APIC|nr:bifunctional Small GTPase/Small GTP-binding protein domain/P-loop containing nucleoside triphosphate hydrolase [Babesia duncani]